VNAATQARRAAPPSPSAADSRLIVAGLVAFAAVHFALAIFMAVAPHEFYTAIGPFGARNDHFVRDVATYNAALGAGLAVSVRRPGWRIPMLAVTTIQFALHSVNHLVDIGDADPGWVGYFDFFALAAATLQLAWLLRIAARTSATTQEGVPR
jgi:hypothetical protein